MKNKFEVGKVEADQKQEAINIFLLLNALNSLKENWKQRAYLKLNEGVVL